MKKDNQKSAVWSEPYSTPNFTVISLGNAGVVCASGNSMTEDFIDSDDERNNYNW